MKQLHDIAPNKGATKKRIRRGRGDASGYGSFSGRGCKGQNARSGGGVRLGFEGGQTPLLKRMPKKKGFKNLNRVEYTPVNLSLIESKYIDGEVVNVATLLDKKVIRTDRRPVKILARGVLTKKVTFEGVSFSKTAQEAIK